MELMDAKLRRVPRLSRPLLGLGDDASKLLLLRRLADGDEFLLRRYLTARALRMTRLRAETTTATMMATWALVEDMPFRDEDEVSAPLRTRTLAEPWPVGSKRK